MGRPLTFKKRVRLADALPRAPSVSPDHTGRRRLIALGATAWVSATVGGLGLHLGWFGAPEQPSGARITTPTTEISAANSLAAEPPSEPATQATGGESEAESAPLPTCEDLLPKLGSSISETGGLPRDLTASGYGALVDQTYAQRTFGHCTERPLQLQLCVILQGGGPIAVTVKTRPPEPRAEACVKAALLTLPYRFHEAPFLLRSHPWLVPSR
jgi:hypothetical protein